MERAMVVSWPATFEKTHRDTRARMAAEAEELLRTLRAEAAPTPPVQGHAPRKSRKNRSRAARE
jgi:hypothetical protein